jgi:hypothetical protein
MDEVFESAANWLRTLSQNAFRVPEGALKVDAGWYAGMPIGPAEFSGELAQLHGSLRQEAAKAAEKARGFLKKTA